MNKIEAQIFNHNNGSEEKKTLKIAKDDDYMAIMMNGIEVDLPIKQLRKYL